MKHKQNQNEKTTITIEGMDLYTLCRWASLKEAIDIVADKCEEKKIDFTSFDLKPSDLLHYVDSMTDELYYKVLAEEKKVNNKEL